jgi:hypothetical protein
MPVIPTTNATTSALVGVGRGAGRRRRLAMRGVPAAIAVGLLLVGSASPAAAADTCSNAALRADNASTALPDCRGYEMVTPSYKEGFPAFATPGLFTDGGILQYRSTGNFAGNGRGVVFNSYRATRSGVGWGATALALPDAIYDTEGAGTLGASDLRWSLAVATRRALPGDTLGFWLRAPDGALTRVGDARNALGTRIVQGFVVESDGLSHVVFNHGPQGVGLTQLYEYAGTGNGAAARAVSVDNHGQAVPDLVCGTEVSPDARVIIFTSGCSGGPVGFSRQVWARVAGSASVLVSGSECTRGAGDPGGACNGASDATYVGRSADGSRVFFTTSQQLVDGDTDAGNDLYACDLPDGVPAPVGAANPCASLIAVTAAAGDAQVENVVAVSADGSRVYFVAKGVLADNLGVNGLGPATAVPFGPEPHNLYVWERDGGHPAGTTKFVARLTGATGNDVEGAQVTPDGRYLLFVTANQLATTGLSADNDLVKDAYRYDAVTHAIVRVSTSVAGGGGNDLGSDVSLVPIASSMTADGSAVIFDSAEALSAADTDGVTDVYRWRDGQVSLISAGGGNSVGITPSGRDIFFETDVPVLSVDGNPNTDVYDARVGGGFPVAQAVPCAGDGCHGQRSQAPPLAGPPAAVPEAVGGGEVPSVFSLRAISAAQRRVVAATGKVSLVVTANAPGTITARATATIGGRSVAVGSGRRTLTAPGRATVVLTLSKKARAQLAKRGRLSVKIAVSHSKVALDRSVTLRLVHARSKAKRSAQRAVAVSVGVGHDR